jgi:hypothetical protein
MSYTVNKFSGAQLIVLEDGTIDTSTSLGLVGRNYVGYGETQNENFVFLLENFANQSPPSRPIAGQTWYNSNDKVLSAYDGTEWLPVGNANISEDAPAAGSLGELWLKIPENLLNVWDGEQWRFIGPEGVPGYDVTRCRSGILVDSLGANNPVIFITIAGTVIGICTARAFIIDNTINPIAGFTTLVAGVNLSTEIQFSGRLVGNATTASFLETPRNINGVVFTGGQDITIKASTTNRLLRGAYITGGDFDGSTSITIGVDATPQGSTAGIGKVVARDSLGNFAAGTITANLIGNVTGNVTVNTGTSTFNEISANKFIGATLTGNADTANRLKSSVTINGVGFDGSLNIIVPASAETLSGTFIKSTVVESSLTSVGLLRSLSVAAPGIVVGSNFYIFEDSNIPTIRTDVARQSIQIKEPTVPGSYAKLDIFNRATAQANSLDDATTVQPVGLWNLGSSTTSFNKIYAEELIGNAETANVATRALNLEGGGVGFLPFQITVNDTGFLAPGAVGQVLGIIAPNQLGWRSVNYTLSLSGDVTGSVVVDNNNNVTLTTTVIDNSHNHTISNVTGLQAALDLKAPIASPALTGIPTSTTPPVTDSSTRIATTRYVKDLLAAETPIWAGTTTIANVIATFAFFPVGTKVAFYEERSYGVGAGNGTATISDLYRRIVRKNNIANQWSDVGG